MSAVDCRPVPLPMQGSASRPLKRPPGLASLARDRAARLRSVSGPAPLVIYMGTPSPQWAVSPTGTGSIEDTNGGRTSERRRMRKRKTGDPPSERGVWCVVRGVRCAVCGAWCVDVCSSLKAYRHVALNVQQPHSKHECRRQGTLLAAPGHETLFTFMKCRNTSMSPWPCSATSPSTRSVLSGGAPSHPLPSSIVHTHTHPLGTCHAPRGIRHVSAPNIACPVPSSPP
jgi:hypothetical protein